MILEQFIGQEVSNMVLVFGTQELEQFEYVGKACYKPNKTTFQSCLGDRFSIIF